MSSRGDEINVRITTTPAQVIEFLERLTDDGEFRQRFEESTGEVLTEYGIEISPEYVPSVVTAPPPEVLRDLSQQIYAAHDSGLSVSSFMGWPLIFFSFMGLGSNPGSP
jgi:hypothetical protein